MAENKGRFATYSDYLAGGSPYSENDIDQEEAEVINPKRFDGSPVQTTNTIKEKPEKVEVKKAVTVKDQRTKVGETSSGEKITRADVITQEAELEEQRINFQNKQEFAENNPNVDLKQETDSKINELQEKERKAEQLIEKSRQSRKQVFKPDKNNTGKTAVDSFVDEVTDPAIPKTKKQTKERLNDLNQYAFDTNKINQSKERLKNRVRKFEAKNELEQTIKEVEQSKGFKSVKLNDKKFDSKENALPALRELKSDIDKNIQENTKTAETKRQQINKFTGTDDNTLVNPNRGLEEDLSDLPRAGAEVLSSLGFGNLRTDSFSREFSEFGTDVGEVGLQIMEEGQEFASKTDAASERDAGFFRPERSVLPDNIADDVERIDQEFSKGIATAGTQLAGFAVGGLGGGIKTTGDAVRDPVEAGKDFTGGLSDFGGKTFQQFTEAPAEFIAGEAGEEVGEAIILGGVLGPAGAAAGFTPKPTPEPVTTPGTSSVKTPESVQSSARFIKGDLGFRAQDPDLKIDVESTEVLEKRTEELDTEEGRVQIARGFDENLQSTGGGVRKIEPVSRTQFLKEKIGLKERELGDFFDSNALGIGPGALVPPETKDGVKPEIEQDSPGKSINENDLFDDPSTELSDPLLDTVNAPDVKPVVEPDVKQDQLLGQMNQGVFDKGVSQFFTQPEIQQQPTIQTQKPVLEQEQELKLENKLKLEQETLLEPQLKTELRPEPEPEPEPRLKFPGNEDNFDRSRDENEEFDSFDTTGRFAESLTAGLFNIQADEEFDKEQTFTGLDIRPLI